jgi:N-acyl-L-homoserine lactone synthetase
MLDDPVPALPGAFQEPLPAALPLGLLPLEGVRTLLRYRTYFRAEAVNSDRLLKMALSLRYQVYCLERNFEEAAHFPDRLETDRYDAQSVHGVLFYRPWDKAIGTTRLILPKEGPASLPFHAMLGKAGTASAGDFFQGRTAEVSRFAVSRSFRPDEGARSMLPCLGLVQLLLRLSLMHDVTHWAAMMQPSLLRMLAMMGIEFVPVGPLVSYHGLRQPCGCEISPMLDSLYRKYPAHWQVVTDGGRLA